MDGMTGRRGIIWKTPDITADGLKLFGCIVMLIQTIGVSIVQNGLIHLDQYTQESLNQAMAGDSRLMTLAGLGSVMQIIGGMAVPIFAFLLVEGFRNTSSYRNYLLTMFVAALVSELPYDLAVSGKLFDFTSQNALVSMCICLIMLKCLNLFSRTRGALGVFMKFLIVLSAIVWVSLFRGEFGLCLVLLTAVFEIFYTKNVLKTFLGAIISLMYITGPLSFYGLWCYTGERKNRINKYVFYIFYPMHLLVLGIIAKFL